MSENKETLGKNLDPLSDQDLIGGCLNLATRVVKRIIQKRVWPEHYEEIILGKKTFELRLDNFECEEGDMLLLYEWDPKTGKSTGRSICKEIGYVLKTKDLRFWPQAEIDEFGFQVISFKPLPEKGDTRDDKQ